MMRNYCQCLVACIVCLLGFLSKTHSQERCGSMAVLEQRLQKNPILKTTFQERLRHVRQATLDRKALSPQLRIDGTTITIPVVFHIVLTNPWVVTDAQLEAQIAQMNQDFAGLNGDSTLIPAAFKPLFAKTNIQFALAQRTPADEPSTGIDRVSTTHMSFDLNDSRVKYNVLGGADAWDNQRFLNVWITNLSQGYLGYASFPGSGPDAEDGVVIKFTALPGGNAPYNKGRTLVHETGHFLFLFHIWGDENGCTGTDHIDDTPNQGTYTSGCVSNVVKTDNCSPNAPGIMYQNFMDYTDDACMVMFTREQQARMESSLSMYRPALMLSNGADPVISYNLDAAVKSINTPVQRVCTGSFTPTITLRNRGAQTLTSATITASINNGAVVAATNWTGSLASLRETTVALTPLTITTEGTHVLTITITSPNGATDEDPSNNTISTTFQYYLPVAPPLTQGFEQAVFPPAGWDVINPDGFITWERTTTAAKTGTGAVLLRSFDYIMNGQKDYLRLPTMNIPAADSAYLTFQVAAAAVTDPDNTGNPFDTLEVLISKDCGITYTSLYKKGGKDLISRATALSTNFKPTASEWRKDSVNLTPYINTGNIVMAFVSNNQHENNIYLDDINVYSVTVNPNLKTKGFMVTPNPTTNRIAVQFFPNQPFVKGVNIYDSRGLRVASQLVNGAGSSAYYFDLTGMASGVYIVQVVLKDEVITKKVIKR